MKHLAKILSVGLSREDVTFFLRALITRPGDIPGILRREAARRRDNAPGPVKRDADGLRLLTKSWEAALAAGIFQAPTLAGPTLRPLPDDSIAKIVTALQTAGSVNWGAADHLAFPALSLEAARLGLPQRADDPAAAAIRRRDYAETVNVSPALAAALADLATRDFGK
jgi:hypothetical protein